MFRAKYVNVYETWKEARCSDWYKTEEEMQYYLDNSSKLKYAQNFEIQQLVNVTSKFNLPKN